MGGLSSGSLAGQEQRSGPGKTPQPRPVGCGRGWGGARRSSRESCPGDVAGILDKQEVRGWAECFLGRAGQAEGAAGAKALRHT